MKVNTTQLESLCRRLIRKPQNREGKIRTFSPIKCRHANPLWWLEIILDFQTYKMKKIGEKFESLRAKMKSLPLSNPVYACSNILLNLMP